MSHQTESSGWLYSRPSPHSLTARIIHWTFIGVFAFALTKRIDDVEELEDFALLQSEMVFASIFLLLLLARFVYMRSTRPTALPDDTPEFLRSLARSGHLAMYASLSMIALTGLTIGGLYWSGVKHGVVMNIVIGLHELAVGASLFMIALHVTAAVHHRLRGDGIWSAMVPVWKEDADIEDTRNRFDYPESQSDA